MVSGDGTNDFYVTYSEGDALYIGMTGEDLTNNDLLIYPMSLLAVPTPVTTSTVHTQYKTTSSGNK